MSVEALSWVLHHSQAKLGARLVLIALANHAHEDGSNAFPSVKTIAARARLSERATQEALRRLEKSGEIERAGHSEFGTVIYRIPMIIPKGGAESAEGRKLATGNTSSSSPEPSSLTKQKATPSVRDEVFDAIATACGVDLGSLTRTLGRAVGQARAEILSASGDSTPADVAAEVLARAKRYRALHPTWELTPDSLRKWWATLAAPSENGWKDLKPKPSETPAEWVARVRGSGLTRTRVVAALKSEWGLEDDQVEALVGSS